nr:Outer membrane efflux protein [uncultured bacterium]
MFSTVVHAQQLTLSLHEAILLAVRSNPNVQVSQLNHIQQKFALHVQEWQFQPHFSVTALQNFTNITVNGAHTATQQTSIQPTATLLTPIGTQVTVQSLNNFAGGYQPGITVELEQPLLRGFGRPIVEAALYNARDSELISRLNIDNTLRSTVTEVINAYLNVVAGESVVVNDKKALDRAQISVQQTQLFIKAGHKAGNEIVTVQADAANAQTTLENDQNSLQQARYALLAAIGLDPNVSVEFSDVNVAALIHKYHVPSLANAQSLSLVNDIQFQTDVITYEGTTKRNLHLAEDNTRWQLNLVANGTLGGGDTGQNNPLNALANGQNKAMGVQLNLTIPFDDQVAKQGVVNAKIAIQEAELALKQERWSKQTNAINGWNSISSAEKAFHFAEKAARLQRETYDITYKKYLYGLIDSTALQSVQQQTTSAEQVLVVAKLNYLKALVNMDLMIGNTLKTWDIGVRYS